MIITKVCFFHVFSPPAVVVGSGEDFFVLKVTAKRDVDENNRSKPLLNDTFCVDKTSKDADVEPDEVENAVLVVPSNHHAQIGDQDILQATNDGGCQSRIELGAHNLNIDLLHKHVLKDIAHTYFL